MNNISFFLMFLAGLVTASVLSAFYFLVLVFFAFSAFSLLRKMWIGSKLRSESEKSRVSDEQKYLVKFIVIDIIGLLVLIPCTLQLGNEDFFLMLTVGSLLLACFGFFSCSFQRIKFSYFTSFLLV